MMLTFLTSTYRCFTVLAILRYNYSLTLWPPSAGAEPHFKNLGYPSSLPPFILFPQSLHSFPFPWAQPLKPARKSGECKACPPNGFDAFWSEKYASGEWWQRRALQMTTQEYARSKKDDLNTPVVQFVRQLQVTR